MDGAIHKVLPLLLLVFAFDADLAAAFETVRCRGRLSRFPTHATGVIAFSGLL